MITILGVGFKACGEKWVNGFFYAKEEMVAKRPASELKNKKTLSENPDQELYTDDCFAFFSRRSYFSFLRSWLR
jgi:hypothetical protein